MSDTNGASASSRIDVNAARAARREARGDEPIIVVIGEDEYRLADELPIGVLDVFTGVDGTNIGASAQALGDVMVALFGVDVYAALKTKHQLTIDDLEVIVAGAMERYGVPLESSRDSSQSSSSTTTPSKPTSATTTKSTPAKRSTAKTR